MSGAVEDVLSRIADAYAALRKENGYQFDVRRVFRHQISLSSLQSTDIPCVIVARIPGAPSSVEQAQGQTPATQGTILYKQRLRFAVLGFLRSDVRNPEKAGLATMAEAFLSDIKRVQMADPSFGSAFCRNSVIVEDFNDAAWEKVGAAVYITGEAYVYWGASSPP